MDWSDEKVSTYTAYWCGSLPSSFECEEHICGYRILWPCGDGECIRMSHRFPFQSLVQPDLDCYNLRNLYFMCEVSRSQRIKLWTQKNGMCTNNLSYDIGHPNMEVISDESKQEICIYLIRCSLSINLHCPCNATNCSLLMKNFCEKDKHYPYPTGALIRPYLSTLYDWQHLDLTPTLFILNGSIKCRGYRAFAFNKQIPLTLNMVRFNRLDYLLCLSNNTDLFSVIQYDKSCWKNSLTFNGQPYAFYDICKETRECISQYRISNQFIDCPYMDDESIRVEQDLCSNIREHRFRCSEDQYSCLTIQTLGDESSHCDNYFDENLYGSGPFLGSILCENGNTDNCGLLKNYMRKKENVSMSITTLTTRIRFRAYCDGEWNLGDHVDESPVYCLLWTCRKDQYQCKTGQCIELNWVCDGTWDCSDASDEEALSINQPWSEHNQKIEKKLNNRKKLCEERMKIQPFSNKCNLLQEYPCYLNNVAKPLDIVKNRPCIPFSQIGDGIANCYNALDEKNTFDGGDSRMKGYRLQCHDDTFLQYPYVCQNDTCFDPVLCSYKSQNVTYCSEVEDVLCLDGSCARNARCNEQLDCPFGEDEYWCQPKGLPSSFSFYRITKKWLPSQEQIVNWPIFPSSTPSTKTSNSSRSLSNSSLYAISFMCNRGIAIFEQNSVSCFCPPAYYGERCQYFSDRLTIIVQVDWTTFSSLNLNDTEFTVEVLFLFNNERIIDRHELHLDPIIGTKKYKFYLLYSRFKNMLRHKQMRYFNRTYIENVQPYSVRFELYFLDRNNFIIELGSWHYPIFFDFLPSYRLAIVLKLPIWFGNKTLDPCTSSSIRKCNRNSECKPILNLNNSFYCSCKYGFYGPRCNEYLSICDSYCSYDSICKASNYGNYVKPFCICPRFHFGSSCHLRHDECDSSPCGIHGTCHITHDLSGERPYQCKCNGKYYKENCQNEKLSIRIELNMNSSQAEASVIQLYDVHSASLDLLLQHQQVYHGIPAIIRYDHERALAPLLGVLKTIAIVDEVELITTTNEYEYLRKHGYLFSFDEQFHLGPKQTDSIQS
ncbi:unnamed protein product [Rotaria sp. Silwood1]|nr:unnamed protein product [Rotaria sp. Silwood1]